MRAIFQCCTIKIEVNIAYNDFLDDLTAASINLGASWGTWASIFIVSDAVTIRVE